MKRTIRIALAIAAVATFVGCGGTRSAVLSDTIGGYNQNRVVYACDDDQLCGSKRMYDVIWLTRSDFPVDYRARHNNYTPDRTKYIHQEQVVITTPKTIFQ